MALFVSNTLWCEKTVRTANVVADGSTELVDGYDVAVVVKLWLADDEARITEGLSVELDCVAIVAELKVKRIVANGHGKSYNKCSGAISAKMEWQCWYWSWQVDSAVSAMSSSCSRDSYSDRRLARSASKSHSGHVESI